MARNTLHSPFAQQHTSGSATSRASPFQQAAVLHGFDAADVEAGWANNHYGPGLRQLYMDVFEPLGGAARSSSSSSRDQDQQYATQQSLASGRSGEARAVRGEELLSRTTSSRAFEQLYFNHIHTVRTRPNLFTSTSAREHHLPAAVSPTHASEHNHRLHTSASLSSSGRSSSSSGVTRSRTLRRLQRRSSSLLAATSATASSLWSSLSDRSRALLCRSSPVVSDSGDSSSVDAVTQTAAAAAAAAAMWMEARESLDGGALEGHTSPNRPPRLSQRLLTRSTAIRRSAAARSPAVLIDVDTTDSYDDLLALDQFNVKRAVKSSVMQNLPCRTPDAEDEQQQRQCHICLQPWLPPPPTAAAAASGAVQQAQQDVHTSHCRFGCCCFCASQQHHQYQQQMSRQYHIQQQQQQQPWGVPPVPVLLEGRLQLQLNRLQFVCWDNGPLGPTGAIVPAPTAARLLTEDALFEDVIPDYGSSSSGQQGPSSRSRGAGAGFWVGSGVVGPHTAGTLRGEPGTSVAAGGSWLPGSSSRNSDGGVAAVLHCSCSAQQHTTRHACAAGSMPGVRIQRLPCGHEFCSGCIQTWLREHVSCPVCRWSDWPEGDTRLINMTK